MKKGFFISFEGLDGSGKSTQISLLARHLEDIGYKVLITFEPGSTELGKIIRKTLLRPEEVAKLLNINGDEIKIDHITEALLYAADRAQHVSNIIMPALSNGFIVISDRYVDSSIAYQGYVRGLGEDLVKLINEKATGSLYPELTIFLDVPVEKMKHRLARREKDRIEREDNSFHKKVRQAYLEIADNNSERVVVVDSNRKKERVFEDIKNITELRLAKHDVG